MDFIATDPIAMMMAEYALQDMGRANYISALLLDGPPGCGKSYFGKYLAWRLRADILRFTFVPGCGREDLILDSIIGADGKRAHGVLLKAMETSREKKVVLLLEELDKAEPRVDSFLLTFLQEGEVLVPQIGLFQAVHSNLLVVITKNDVREASGPLVRRCRTIFMKWPSVEVESRILQQALPNLPLDACKAVIEPANVLRNHPAVPRPPSTPELIRICRDLVQAVKEGRDHQAVGHYYVRSVAPRLEDQVHIDKPTFLGLRLKEKLEHYVGSLDVPATSTH
jgi:MoxR-like ATPase